jgi:hypothetical protein
MDNSFSKGPATRPKIIFVANADNLNREETIGYLSRLLD